MNGESHSGDLSRRERLIQQAVYDYLTAYQSDDALSLQDFERQHADLLPDLHESLVQAVKKHRQVVAMNRQLAVADTLTQHLPVIVGFQLKQVISAGGQGTVYEAVQENTGRTVAIKVIQSESRHIAQRFEREVRALAELKHPFVVSIIDCGRTARGSFFIAMDFVIGSRLDEWLAAASKSRTSQPTVVELFKQIAQALAECHRSGIAHRDLKPSNILVDSAGHPRLIDFGMSRATGDIELRQLTQTGNILGSLEWLSPDQAMGSSKLVGPLSDIYSFGLLLYFALGGRMPYNTAGPAHEVIRTICNATPKSLADGGEFPFGRVPQALADIVNRCLEKKPADRFPSVDALLGALVSYPSTVIEPRRRWIVAFATAVVAVIASAAIITLGASHHASVDQKSPLPPAVAMTNSIGMRFVLIRAGRFQMGSSINSPHHQDDEDEHVVTLTRDFLIGQSEVTQKQFATVMGRLPHQITRAADNLPVDFVTWSDAMQFCLKISQLEGRQYSLPSEAQWEYACTTGLGDKFAAGDLPQLAWYGENSSRLLEPTCSKLPNVWGIYDMQGNAAEYVLDNYVAHLGFKPISDPLRHIPNQFIVVKGGTCVSNASECRGCARAFAPPDKSWPAVGFRIITFP